MFDVNTIFRHGDIHKSVKIIVTLILQGRCHAQIFFAAELLGKLHDAALLLIQPFPEQSVCLRLFSGELHRIKIRDDRGAIPGLIRQRSFHRCRDTVLPHPVHQKHQAK